MNPPPPPTIWRHIWKAHNNYSCHLFCPFLLKRVFYSLRQFNYHGSKFEALKNWKKSGSQLSSHKHSRFPIHNLSLFQPLSLRFPRACFTLQLFKLIIDSIFFLKSKFSSERMFLYRGFSLLQSEHPLFLHFPGLFFKIFFVKVEAF